MSHPVWVRGLKPATKPLQPQFVCVAPRVGAWIETINAVISFFSAYVAPRVGAWIETRKNKYQKRRSGSHPVWVRGLKLCRINQRHIVCCVAPRVGAWIETLSPHCNITEYIVAPRVGAWIETLILLP